MISRFGLIGALLCAFANPAAAAMGRYVIDPEHFTIAFMASHLGYERTLGQFLKGTGGFELDDEAETLANIRVEIDADSVFTNHAERDRHLRSADFLAAREFPKITFTGTSFEKSGINRVRITGELTLLGRKRPLVLEATLNKLANYPIDHRRRTVGVSARAKLKRSDFGMTYGTDNGLVGDEIELIFEFEANLR
ncbi:MAG: YceI family protein [Alphaproteobacteria bacterium]|nr:YceI family protein [Alphaproteobacteria bacterium]